MTSQGQRPPTLLPKHCHLDRTGAPSKPGFGLLGWGSVPFRLRKGTRSGETLCFVQSTLCSRFLHITPSS